MRKRCRSIGIGCAAERPRSTKREVIEMLKGVKTQKAVLGILAMMLVALLAAGFLTPSTAVAAPPQPEGYPTEIDATPSVQTCSGCPPVAHWTIYLSGGTSGPWHVVVSYGDPHPDGDFYIYNTVWYHSHSFSYDCNHTIIRYQTWRASRAGGGTGYDYTQVGIQN